MLFLLKQIYRRLLREKGLLLISIGGLTLSMVAGIVIFHYLFFELSFDKFHTDTDRIYRIDRNVLQKGEVPSKAGMSSSMMAAEILKTKVSGVESTLRMHPVYGDANVKTGSSSFIETNLFYSDASFFSFFTFKCLYGDANSALSSPNNVVLSKSASEKIFHTANSINQSFDLYDRYLGKRTYTVAAVFDDLPLNTHLKVNMLFPITNLLKHEQYTVDPWKWANFRTYVKLNSHTKPKSVTAQMDEIVKSENIASRFNSDKIQYGIFPLASIHLSGISDRFETNSNTLNILLILFAGILVIMVAWLNYLNLSQIRVSGDKGKIVVKKILGAEKYMFRKELILESLVVYTISFAFAVGIYSATTRFLESRFGLHIQLLPYQLAIIWAVIIVTFSGFSVLTGMLLSFRVNRISRNKNASQDLVDAVSSRHSIRILSSFQFSGAIILVCFSLLAIKQINYMFGKESGFNKDNILNINSPRLSAGNQNIYQVRSAFREEALKIPGVKALTSSVYIPGSFISSIQGIRIENESGIHDIDSRMNWVGTDYLTLYENKFIAGRNFTMNVGVEDNSFIINRKLSEQLGYANPDDAIGKEVLWKQGNKKKMIVGVVENFFHESPEKEIYPMAFHFANDVTGYYSIKIASDIRPDLIMRDLQRLWNQMHEGNPFDYSWLDKSYDAQYNQWIRMKSIFITFSFLAIIISAMGLIGHIGLLLAQRTKEIGIRKVNGARISEVLVMLNKDFVKWVVIAFVIATPIAYFAMHKWLQNFAYKTELSWWIFALSGLIALSIALLTASWQTYRAARQNPVEALRYE